MSEEIKKNEEQDLNWQKPSESDNLQKSEHPDQDYMRGHNLCPQCHGIKHEGDCRK